MNNDRCIYIRTHINSTYYNNDNRYPLTSSINQNIIDVYLCVPVTRDHYGGLFLRLNLDIRTDNPLNYLYPVTEVFISQYMSKTIVTFSVE